MILGTKLNEKFSSVLSWHYQICEIFPANSCAQFHNNIIVLLHTDFDITMQMVAEISKSELSHSRTYNPIGNQNILTLHATKSLD